jgi:polyhydroxyalkanoate synthesis regulator phasin
MQNPLLRQLLMMGLETTNLVVDRLQKTLDDWVKDGRLNQKDAKEFLDDMLFRLKEEQGNFEDQFQRRLRATLKDIGVPENSDVEALRNRVEQLEYQVRQLQERQERR